VPKEIKTREYRVGLTPGGVREFVAHGHTVLVEAGLGAGIAASDRDYQDAGAAVLDNAGAVFAQAELIVKVKEPQPAEWSRLREGQILFTYLHLAADPEQARGLMDSGCTAVAYETVTDDYGGLPLLAPMSEVAGRLAIEAAGTTLQRHVGGRGILIGGVAGVAPARVLILGGGVVGAQAARMAVGLGADVTILDRSVPRLRLLDEMLQGRAKTLYATASSIEEQALVADVFIGAVLVAGARAPKLIARSLLARMRRGAVLVDVAIDQGGCFETSRPTTYDAPIYEVDGVMHYCVSNMPGAVPVTSSHALGNATLPFGLAIAKNGLNAIAADQHLQAGLNVYRGAITNAAVATSLSLPFVPFSEAVRRSATT
jgi:alanine dehydrogenase